MTASPINQYEYDRADAPDDALRLHLNEHTGGCSPAVMDAIARVARQTVAKYPDYTRITGAVAGHIGVPDAQVLLTNGLDEGIFAVAIAQLRGDTNEAVIIEEIVWLASLLPRGALLLLDEAYVEFAGGSFLPLLQAHPNVVVGRTFAKAYGLAGMRVGAVIASEAVIARLRRVVPPYSLNVFVVAALEAALGDRAYMDAYRRAVQTSRQLLYAACDRWGLPYVRSDANFVLVRAGDRRQALLDGLQARGIYIRDRDRQPGCAGCVRITTGLVEHTEACIAAMEEILCGRA